MLTLICELFILVNLGSSNWNQIVENIWRFGVVGQNSGYMVIYRKIQNINKNK
jgi:hypothetical protein